MSVREAVQEIRSGGFSELSDSRVHAGTWITQADSDIDYRTGEHRTESLHFKRDTGPRDQRTELSAHQLRRLYRAAGVRVR